MAHTADEAMEAVANGLGAVLISAGNVSIYERPGISFVPVEDLEPSTLAVVWRIDDHRPIIRAVAAVAEALGMTGEDPGTVD